MPLIKAGRAIADSFIHVADGEPLPTDGAIIIGLARWQEERGLIEPRRDPLGVRLKAGDPVEQLAGDLDRLAVIALEFPKFNDGRAFSQARLLRERFGYRGEIRATGKVVRDLLLFMHRCGFDAYRDPRPGDGGDRRAQPGQLLAGLSAGGGRAALGHGAAPRPRRGGDECRVG